MEDQLNGKALSLSLVEKKLDAAETKVKEQEDLNRRIRENAMEEFGGENKRLKDYYGKLVARQEGEIKGYKEQVRIYELQVHELEVQAQALSNEKKEGEIESSDLRRRLNYLTTRL